MSHMHNANWPDGPFRNIYWGRETIVRATAILGKGPYTDDEI